MNLEKPTTEKISDHALKIQSHRDRANRVFRDLAIYETAPIDDAIAEMLALKAKEVLAARPDLDEVECYIVAGRLLKQLISCYQSALNQLLP